MVIHTLLVSDSLWLSWSGLHLRFHKKRLDECLGPSLVWEEVASGETTNQLQLWHPHWYEIFAGGLI